jgi:hypothetical protein
MEDIKEFLFKLEANKVITRRTVIFTQDLSMFSIGMIGKWKSANGVGKEQMD